MGSQGLRTGKNGTGHNEECRRENQRAEEEGRMY